MGRGADHKIPFITWQDIDFKAVEIDREKWYFWKKITPALNGRLLEMIFFRWKDPLKEDLPSLEISCTISSTEILLKYWSGGVTWSIVTGMFQKK